MMKVNNLGLIWVLYTSCVTPNKNKYRQHRQPLPIFQKNTLDKYVFDKSPKIWLKYIQAFLYSTCKKNFKNISHLKHKVKPSFLIDIFKQTLIKCKSFLLVREKPKIYEYETGIYLEGIQKQIITYTQTRLTWAFIFPKDETQQLAFYYVHLSPTLGLNVTFNKVYFPVSVFEMCDQTKMLVCDDKAYFWEVDKIRNVMIRELNDIGELLDPDDVNHCHEFCGVYSKGNVYPHGQKLQLLFHGGSTSLVDLLFSVVDQSRIYIFTHEHHEKTQDLYPEWRILFLQKQKYYFYYLSVMKFQIIFLNITCGKTWGFHIYDGPSALSPHLLLNHYTDLYQTTSFHCSIYTMTSSACVVRQKLSAKFHAKRSGKYIHKFVSTNETQKLAFGSVHFHGDFHQLNLTCDSPSFLNISILSVIPTGLLSADCRFSGIAFYENNQGTYHEDSNFCGTEWITDRTWKYRNVFSSSSSLLVIYYRQLTQGSSEIYMTVSSTYCKPLKINICKFGKYIDLFAKFFDGSRPGHMSFRISKDKCLLLLIVKPSFLIKRRGCLLFIKSGDIETSGMSVKHHIKGYFAKPIYGMFFLENFVLGCTLTTTQCVFVSPCGAKCTM